MADVDYTIDFSKALAALDKIGEADARLRAEAIKTSEAYRKRFEEEARAAIAQQERLAAQVREAAEARAIVQEHIAALRQLRESQKQMNAEAKNNPAAERAAQLSQELKRNQAEQDKLRQLIAESRIAYQQEGQAVAAVRDEIRRQQQEQKLVTAAARDTAVAEREAATAAKQVAQQEKEAAAAAEKAARAAGILTQLEQKLKDLTEARAKATTRSAVQGYTSQIKDTQKQINDLKGGADQAGGAVSGMFGRFAGAAGAAAAVTLVIGFVKNLAGEVIEAGKKADATLGKLQFARGNDLEKAAGDFTTLRYEANRLGLDLNAAGASYGSFTAAAAAGNLPLSEARRLYLAVGGASAVLRVSSADTEGALRALQQMVSKGTVSAEELRGQLGERLPGAFSIAARAIGVTEKELGKMLERGEIVASDFLPKFARELEKTFGDGTAAAADSLQANTNRIQNEWERFLLRFVSASGSAVSSIAKLAKQANDFLDGFTPEGQENLATERTIGFVKRYQDRLEKLLDQTAQAVKARGGNVTEAIANTLDVNQARLQKNLEEAEALQKKYTNQQFIVDNGGYNKVGPLRDANLVRISLLRGEIQVLEDVRAARKKASDDEDKNLEGLIDKQRKLIKSLQDRQTAARAENKQQNTGSGDYLFGKGGLNQQVAEAQKELDRLLGKVDKTLDKLSAALKALESERRRLQKEFDRAELEDLKEAGQVRAAEQLRQDLNSINQLEQTLKDKEATVREAGGRGADADGVIDGVQQEELNKLRALAEKRYQEEIQRIKRDYAARSLTLQRDSDEKELAQLRAKHAEEIRQEEGANRALLTAIARATKAGNMTLANSLGEMKLISDALLEDLRRAAAEQETLLKRAQALRAIDANEKAVADGINADGPGITQFTDVTADQSGQIEANATKRLNLIQRLIKRATEVQLNAEKEQQKQLLQNQINGNNARLLQYQNDFTEQGLAIKADLISKNKQLVDQLGTLSAENEEGGFSLYRLILGKKDNEENRKKLDEAVQQSAAILKDAATQLVQAEIQAAQERVEAKTREIDNLQRELDRELQYQKDGSASSVANKRAEIAELKRQRREALQDQKKAQREQLLLDSISQLSQIATASATIFNVTSELNLVPGLGTAIAIGLIGTMIAAFAASKVKALNVINQQKDSGFFKGGYTGDGHERQESRNLGQKSYIYHNKEFVHDHELTALYRQVLFEPLHQRRPQDIDWGAPQMQDLLPNFSLPAQVQAEKQAAAELRVTHQFLPMQNELHGLRQELVAIREHTGASVARKDVVPTSDGYMTVDPVTRSTHRVRLAGPSGA